MKRRVYIIILSTLLFNCISAPAQEIDSTDAFELAYIKHSQREDLIEIFLFEPYTLCEIKILEAYGVKRHPKSNAIFASPKAVRKLQREIIKNCKPIRKKHGLNWKKKMFLQLRDECNGNY